MLFVTSDSRSPQVIPISGLQDAGVVTHDILPRGPKLDMHPLMPYGPVGKAVMFNGVPLHTTLVDGSFFTSVSRDPYKGNLNLDTNPTWFPNRIHDMRAELDFPQYDPADSKARMEN